MASGIPLSKDTREALKAAVGAFGSMRRWAREHGLSPALVSDILSGHDEDVSVRAENRVRAVLGLPPIPPRLPAACCPDCLARGIEIVHGDGLRCHGKENAIAIIIGGDEKVVRARKRARQRARGPCLEVRGLSPEGASWWRGLSPAERGRLLEQMRKGSDEQEQVGDPIDLPDA